MNKDLHKHNEPLISAEDGWKQMQQLLDENLPLKLIKRNRFTQYLVASSILIMLMLPSLQLDENSLIKSSVSTTRNTLGKIDNKNQTAISLHNLNNATVQDLVFFNVASIKKKRTNPSLRNDENHIINIRAKTVSAVTVRAIEEKTTTIIDYNPVKRIDSFTTRTIHSENTQSDKKNRISLQKKSWTFSAGVAANLPIANNAINVRPNPVFELKYNFTPRFYFSTGISPYTFVNNSTGAISKAVYLNDTVNNISMDKETTLYDHFHYLDIPVSLGVNVTKRIALQAGLQVSFLLNNKEKKVLEGYDFLMNRLTVPATLVMSLVPDATTEYDVKVKNIDYRILAGIRYNLNKASLGLTYQQGLTSILTNSSGSSSKNNLVSLDLLVKIK